MSSCGSGKKPKLPLNLTVSLQVASKDEENSFIYSPGQSHAHIVYPPSWCKSYCLTYSNLTEHFVAANYDIDINCVDFNVLLTTSC